MAGNDRFRAPWAQGGLLGANDPPPVEIINPRARSPFLLIGDHCGNRIPEALDTLGLKAVDRERHIAWDIGTAALGEHLARDLDAVFIRQAYSRLVVDCNRDPDAPDAIPERSDGTVIPANQHLSREQRHLRIAAIHQPYQDSIAAEIRRRGEVGLPVSLVSLHSFTSSMNGIARPWQIGVLHDGANDATALRLLEWLRAQERWRVGDNEPYVMDKTDHTVPRHAFASGISYVEIELSQDQLLSEADCSAWSAIISQGLRSSVSSSHRSRMTD
jgi:predicted N-formylglutamate amidohydrolase